MDERTIEDFAETIATRIKNDVCGRSGGDHWFDGCHHSIQAEIFAAWKTIAREQLRAIVRLVNEVDDGND